MKSTLLTSIFIVICQITFSQEVTLTSTKKEEIKTYIKHFESNNQLLGTDFYYGKWERILQSNFWRNK